MNKLFFIFFIFCPVFIYSQIEADTVKTIKLDQILVSPLRHSQSKRKIAQPVETISKNEIEFLNSASSADLLANTGKLTIQKSQQGGGSPVIRGFEASRILLLIDGVRMNNLIYRAGHLQNLITVDQNILDKVDILLGPSSTLYGSDALGGAIYLHTKEAMLLSQKGVKPLTGNVFSNYSTVNDGKLNHFDLNFAGSKWAALSSFSYTNFGDLRMGKTKNGSNDYFGERPFYVVTINGVDQLVSNGNRYVQKNSGYQQYDFMQKVLFKQNDLTTHSINFQYSTSSDIPRYDRLTELSADGNLKYAVWKYGPQKRFLTIYKLAKEKVFTATDMNLNLSFQNSEESRINRNFGSTNEKSRIEKVSMFGLSSDFNTKMGTGNLIYGVDLYADNLKSTAFQKDIMSGVLTPLDTRYPDGKNTTARSEVYVSFNDDISRKTFYTIAARAGYTALNSTINTNYFNLPYTSITQNNFIYSGAFGLVNNPDKDIKLAFNLATAFRVPNIDDLSKIFESSSGVLIVPNENLKPEKAVTADLNITFWNGNRFQFENVFYITKLYDAIQTDVFTFNGQTSIVYDGQVSQVFANQNQGIGHLTGYSSVVKGYITKSIVFEGIFNYTHGRLHTGSGSYPLDHIAPMNGKIGFSYESKNVNASLYMLYNGKKDVRDYSPSGEDNLQYATVYGAPSWQTYNLKGAFHFIKNTLLLVGVENIFDLQYRTFSSGINAPGRTLYIGTKYNF